MASYLAKSQSDLPSRKLYDSYDEAIIPLSTDLEFREAYHNALHRVRFGRLLEDLDTFAGVLECLESFVYAIQLRLGYAFICWL